MKDWMDAQDYRLQIFFYILGGCIGALFIFWVWSLFFNLFYSSSTLPSPLLAPFLLLDYENNSAKLNIILVITLLMPLILIGMAIVGSYRHKQIIHLFGNAHWASMTEIRKMGLFGKEGLIIGDKKGRLLRAKLVSHALIFAPSRSGKGVSQVMPNALAFEGSMLCIDMKLEIFLNTSGFRQKSGQAVYLFAPANLDGKTHCWNPLDLVSRHPVRLISDLQLVTNIIIPESSGGESMWVSEARSIAIGLLLWLLESGRPFTLGELTSLVKGTVDFSGFLTEVINNSITAENLTSLNPVAFMNINNFVSKAFKEQSGVKSTLTARLNLWDDPLVNAATSKSDFDVREMRKKRMTVYLGIPTNQLERLAPLMNLFVQLFVNAMTEELPQQNEPYKVLVMLDEFCALGRMDTLKEGFGFLAGYNLHLMAIIQNVGQFYSLYGGRDGSDVFFQNTDYKIAYRQNTKTDREFVSEQLGTRTVRNESKSYTGGLLNGQLPNTNESVIGRPLLSPDEVRVFPKEEAIAIINGEPPVRYQRILHYQDNRFKNRVLSPLEIKPITPCYPTLRPVKKIETKPETDSNHDKAALTSHLTAAIVTAAQQLTTSDRMNNSDEKEDDFNFDDLNDDDLEIGD